MVTVKRMSLRKKISGFLTKEDVKLLEEASMRKPSKYKKSVVNTWLCSSCNYKWLYKTVKCPACESQQVKEV